MSFGKEIDAGHIAEGDGKKLAELLGLLDAFHFCFNIVTP